jgi:hypothetical protein
MSNNKFLYSIYKSVKTLNKAKMDFHTKNINNLIGGGSDEDVKEIMNNLGLIESGVIDYFKSLQTYIEIYLKNANEFEKLFADRLSIDSLKKLSESMKQLNSVLATLK